LFPYVLGLPMPMTDLFHNLRLGFGVAVSPVNLLLCLVGTLVCSD
jgi:hypothetical protein